MSTHTRRSDSGFRIGLGLPLMVLATVTVFDLPWVSAEDGEHACSATSKAAWHACRHEAQDDFWIARGNCTNLSEPASREACEDDAEASLQEARSECREQFEAREELCDALGQAPYDPVVDPAMFVDPFDVGSAVPPNSFFPLVPGTWWVFENEADGEEITVTVTPRTREILGVSCIIVRDVVRDQESGEVIEDTEDYYAQDRDGNVWYFGEVAQEFEEGFLTSLEGSWIAGVDFAKPGIIMEASPWVGDVYRQEFALGDAEDAAEVLALDGDELTPAASCEAACLVTRDFTPLEPDVEEYKYYKPGVGPILEIDPETGSRTELVDYRTP